MSRFQPGDRVRHPAFGLGEVLRIEEGRSGDHPDGVATTYAVLRFDYDTQQEHRVPETQKRCRLAKAKDEKETFGLARFRVGERVWHESFGLGVVVALRHASNGSLYEARFDSNGQVRSLSPQHAPWRAATDLDAPRQRAQWAEIESRLARTFEFEPESEPHGHGGRWESFFAGGAHEMLEQLPEIFSKALMQEGYGGFFAGPYKDRGSWRQTALLVWPLRMKGMQLVIGVGGDSNALLSAYPVTLEGSEHGLTLEKVMVWPNGVEAQIEARLGPAIIRFFDIAFTINRGWYLAQHRYQFVLTGIAYSAGPAENRELLIPAASPGARAMRQIEAQHLDEPVRIDPLRIQTCGMAMLLPLSDGDADDYEFHGPIVEVRDTEILGQPAWRVRAVVLRETGDAATDQDIALEVLVTRRVWSGQAPPTVGQDIEGRLWLQGRLWDVQDRDRLQPL